MRPVAHANEGVTGGEEQRPHQKGCWQVPILGQAEPKVALDAVTCYSLTAGCTVYAIAGDHPCGIAPSHLFLEGHRHWVISACYLRCIVQRTVKTAVSHLCPGRPACSWRKIAPVIVQV